ncbi:aspartate--ammonia ligase [Caerostris darwini]|uniref:Aspartate--ammonia ligase n=1 Tax=Caerostris darwini TaxID=1538125 RepID=A0AAV4UQH5_9ARAC|nr:aspartate--ammonia ligase [Caerostris darwini]
MEYNSKLSVHETLKAVQIIKAKFKEELCTKLNLNHVSSPLFVETDSGINDDLNGSERPVTFDTKSGMKMTVVQSLAKWKRMALKKYEFGMYCGLCVDMNAIRRDEDLGPMHSNYVDQCDWEKVIKEDRNMTSLESIVKDIYHSQQLVNEYPHLTPKECESEYTRKHGAVFVCQVGKTLKSGEKHDGRAPDYDDWDLNGDILVHHDALDVAFELSSMGIRVTKESLLNQLTERNALNRLNLPFHKALMSGELPFTVGGGIGQYRLCMYLLDKIHIGEVQCSVWNEDILAD